MLTAITATTLNGSTYYTTRRAGVEYTAQQLAGQWFVSTRRLALGRHHAGGGRYYATLADLASQCKAFAGLDALIAAGELAGAH